VGVVVGYLHAAPRQGHGGDAFDHGGPGVPAWAPLNKVMPVHGPEDPAWRMCLHPTDLADYKEM
jgi:hypothetical protein